MGDVADFVRPKQPTIHGFTMSVSVLCGCGSPTPLHVSFVAGMHLKAQCQACGGHLFLGVLEFDFRNPNGLRVGVAYQEPVIVRPGLVTS